MNSKEPNAITGAVPFTAFARLRAALFLSGAAVMELEILGTRIIGPHFGVGLFVWTSLIAVTLFALALGYWLGGLLADRRPSLLCFACVLLAAGAVVALIPLLRRPVLDGAWAFGLRGGCLFAATALFLPPLLLLGMASPFAVRIEADGVEHAGLSAGRLYAISTAGSIVGALLTGFLLVPLLRVPDVLAIVAGELALAAVLAAAPGLNRRVTIAAAAIALAAIGLAWPTGRPPELIDARTSAGTDLRVVDYEGSRYLFVDEVIQTSMDRQGRSKDKYIYFIAARLFMARPQAKTVALVGLGGGGIVPLLVQQGLDLECAELSPEVIALARARFGFSLPPSKVHAMDGRVFLQQRPGRFDAIVLDVFTGDRLAYPLVSLEGLNTAKRALTDGGLLAVNTWGIDLEHGGPNRVGAAIRLTLQQAFRHVLAVPADGNLLFFASDQPIIPGRGSVVLPAFDGPRSFTWAAIPPANWPDAVILTDDLNPVDVLGAAALEKFRVARRTSFPARVRDALDWE